jgi:chorismate lyase / 3-hydroxybenzoate synthase
MSMSSGPRAEQQSRRWSQNPGVPCWVGNLIRGQAKRQSLDGFEMTVSRGEAASLVSLSLLGARELDSAQFEQRTAEAFGRIRSLVATLGHKHPVRFWNAVPDIHQQLDADRDRYMVFNAGRFHVFDDWFGESGQFTSRLPAASTVGHHGDTLYLNCLAFGQPGVALENPRQTPAFRYSSRYGALPPCFARACVVAHPLFEGPVLVASGTASILGEQSVHKNDLESQLSESLENLRTLIDEARGRDKPAAKLDAFVDLRVFHTRRQDAGMIESTIRRSIGSATSLQISHAELCRTDLLVEIEGIARLGRPL